jgi:ribosomal protein L7/L12
MNDNIKLEKIADDLSNLTFNEQILLIKTLEEKCGFTFNTGMQNSTEQEDTVAKKPESSLFKVSLIEIPSETANKFKIIKALTNVLGLDLIAAKSAIDKLPLILKENLTKEESAKLSSDLEQIAGVKTETTTQ